MSWLFGKSTTPKPAAAGTKKSLIPSSATLPNSAQPSSPQRSSDAPFARRSRPPSPSPPSPGLHSTAPASSSPATLGHQLAVSPSSSSPADLEALTSSLFSSYASSDAASFNEQLSAIRSHILFHGIPPSPTSSSSPSSSSLRGRLWCVFLGVGPVSSQSYVALIGRGRSEKYAKIRGDSFRTFPQDAQFTARVKEEEIVRVLNAFVHQYGPGAGKAAGESAAVFTFTYCQGMNTIAAPMLYCMGELCAYAAFSAFVVRCTPLYWLSSHIGVEAGCKLVDRCLQAIDPELWQHLHAHHLHSYLYAFHCVSSFSASVPPFSQLLLLWDFLLAFGPHLNILAVTAQVIALRRALLASDAPKTILDYRKWPPLRARVIIAMCMSFVGHIDAALYEEIRWHASDRDVAERITGRRVELGVKE